jgi:hypothetical protein
MKFVCDAPGGRTWFQIETEAEAACESEMMRHAVEKYFQQEWAKAAESYTPPASALFEQEIGLRAHIRRVMPRFLTLRDEDGKGLATAMLPPKGEERSGFRTIIVGVANADPYVGEASSIAALGTHLGLRLDRASCYPYKRGQT